jgi:ribosome biogenesis protein MAK21
MKGVFVREISSLVLRPPAAPASAPLPGGSSGKHIRFDDAPKPKPKADDKKPTVNTHARYYGTITLNQIVLSPTDKIVASALLDVYFDLFKDILGEDSPSSHPPQADSTEEQEVKVDKQGRILSKKQRFNKKHDGKEYKGAAGFTELEDAHSKLVSAILTGMHRAFPFAPLDNNSRIEKHLDTLFLITHTSTFNSSLQALVLIQQISASLESAAASSSKDVGEGTSKGGLKTTAKSTKDRYYRTLYSSLHDPRLADSSKQAMYLNLLFKSIKHLTSVSSSSSTTSPSRPLKKPKKSKGDVAAEEGAHKHTDENEDDRERMIALIRRFIQVLVSSGNGTTEFVVGGLYLLGEVSPHSSCCFLTN